MTETMGSLNDHAQYEMVAARQVLAEAKYLLKGEHLGGAISRCYYPFFHAARAALNTVGIALSTHKGVKTELNRLLVNDGKLEQKYGDMLQDARDLRHEAAYEVSEKDWLPTTEGVNEVVANTATFLDRIEDLINQDGRNSKN